VSDARVLRGHDLLNAAALNAVKQWKYSPTYLNGDPVPVIATVTISFKLE
jgi:protein TonB